MKKLINIIQGYWYWLRQPPVIKKKAEARMRICMACPHKKGPFCGLCGCVLKAKTSSPDETCPELRWEAPKFETRKDEFVYNPPKSPASLEEHIQFAKERGESSCRAMPLSEETKAGIIATGSYSIQEVRNKQRPGCKDGCVDNYDIISWTE